MPSSRFAVRISSDRHPISTRRFHRRLESLLDILADDDDRYLRLIATAKYFSCHMAAHYGDI
jgi:hypothetical protein